MNRQIRQLIGRRMNLMADYAALTDAETILTPERHRRAVQITGEITDTEIELVRAIRSQLAEIGIERTVAEVAADVPGMIRNLGVSLRRDRAEVH